MLKARKKIPKKTKIKIKFLLLEGVHQSAIVLATWGSDRPLARPEDHAVNRRVELEYLTLDIARAL